MKHLVILGAGTAGTMVANRLRKRLPSGWALTLVDPEPVHLYQPGLLFIPFGARDEARMTKPRRDTLRSDVRWVERGVSAIEPEARAVVLEGGERIAYDLLVVATGSRVRPEETPGLTGPGWEQSAFEFYTLPGAQKLRAALDTFTGGRLAVHVTEMPIKCPVAPLEFVFLADDFLRRRGLRDRTELVFVTPLDGAFTKPAASRMLGHLIEDKGIRLETEFNVAEVDGEARLLRSYDEREVPYDLLVTVPLHGGAAMIESSGLGNELGFMPTDPHTLLARADEHIFVLGDATDLPSSKAGSVAHFQAEGLEHNLLRAMRGDALANEFDGHANCFIETGRDRALLIDFNYETEPLPGKYPWPVVGPLSLLEESRLNHLGKKAFRWAYWNLLLPGRPLPVSRRMSMAGKRPVPPPEVEEGVGHVTV